MSSFLAMKYALDAVTDAMERPLIDVKALRLARHQTLSPFAKLADADALTLSADFQDICPDSGDMFAFEVRVFQVFDENWCFSIDGYEFLETEYSSPQKAAEALAEVLASRDYMTYIEAFEPAPKRTAWR